MHNLCIQSYNFAKVQDISNSSFCIQHNALFYVTADSHSILRGLDQIFSGITKQ